MSITIKLILLRLHQQYPCLRQLKPTYMLFKPPVRFHVWIDTVTGIFDLIVLQNRHNFEHTSGHFEYHNISHYNSS